MLISRSGLGGYGGFYREVRIPNLCRGLHLGGAFGPDLSPARPRRTTHPLPPHGSPPADRRDRRAARPAPVHHLSGAGAQPLPRRGPRVLRLLPPERPGPRPPTPAATSQAGRRRRPAGARGRAAQGRLVAAADRRTAE